MTAAATLRVGETAAKLSSMRRNGLGAAALLAVVTALGPGTLRAAEERVIYYQDDRLTVRLERVPLADVLAELSRKSGAQIRGELRNPGEVSASFERIPLSEGLSRLLGEQNFALIYADGGRLRAVKLLGAAGPPGANPMPAFAVSSTTVPTTGSTALVAALQRHPPLPISGRLAEVLGSPTASFQTLFDTAMRHEDPGVRAEALRVALNGLEGDGELRSSAIATLNGFDDSALGTLVQGLAGERAEEFAMHVATQARASELRVKASTVLQRLHEQAAARQPPGG
jgi:hypothetical protein